LWGQRGKRRGAGRGSRLELWRRGSRENGGIVDDIKDIDDSVILFVLFVVSKTKVTNILLARETSNGGILLIGRLANVAGKDL